MGNADQPRAPAGSPQGGQWVSSQGGSVKFYDNLTKGWNGKVVYELRIGPNKKIKTKADAVNSAIAIAEAQGYRTSQLKWKVEPAVVTTMSGKSAPKISRNARLSAAIIAKEQALGASAKGTYSVLSREQSRSKK